VGVNGDVLLATAGRGVGVITKNGGYAITRRDSLLEDKVFAIADRADGTRYFATAVGLCAQMNDTSFVSFQAGSGIPRGEVRAVVAGERNAFYLLIANHGVFRFDGMRAVPVAAPKGMRFRDANAISFGSDGTLWVAGTGWVYARRRDKWTQAPIAAADAGVDWARGRRRRRRCVRGISRRPRVGARSRRDAARAAARRTSGAARAIARTGWSRSRVVRVRRPPGARRRQRAQLHGSRYTARCARGGRVEHRRGVDGGTLDGAALER
jgi:hypothetical protein